MANKSLAEIALREVGTREEGGNNRGPRIREYQAATWLEPDAWPWCAAFVDWCVLQWLMERGKTLGLNPTVAESWRPRTAGAWDLERWARKRHLKVLPDTAIPEPGDIVLYDFSHCGIVTGVSPDGKTIHTVEGNTNGAGERESTTGDGVWAKVRPRSLAKCFIRILTGDGLIK